MSNNYIESLINELKDLISKSSANLKIDARETFEKQCESYKKLLSMKNDIDSNDFNKVLYKIEFNLTIIYLRCTEKISFTIDYSRIKYLAPLIDNCKTYLDNLCSNDLVYELERIKIKQIGFIYLKISELYLIVSNLISRIKCIKTAYEILNNLNNIKDKDTICKLLITMATTTNRFRRFDECEQYTLAVEDQMKYLKDSDLKAKIYSDLSTIYVKESTDKSLQYLYLAKALELKRSDRIMSVVYQNIGATNNISKQYEEALVNSRNAESCIEKELKYLETDANLTPEKLQREKTILIAQLSNVYFNIGYSNVLLKNNEEAVKYFEKSHKKAKFIQSNLFRSFAHITNINFNVLVESLEAIAAVQSNYSDYSLSKKYLEQAKDILIKINPQNTVFEQRLSRKIKEVSALEKSRNLIKHKDESIEDTQRETERKDSQESGDNDDYDDDDDDDDDDEDDDDDDDDSDETETETQKQFKMKVSKNDRFSMVTNS